MNLEPSARVIKSSKSRVIKSSRVECKAVSGGGAEGRSCRTLSGAERHRVQEAPPRGACGRSSIRGATCRASPDRARQVVRAPLVDLSRPSSAHRTVSAFVVLALAYGQRPR
ncbi:hypothetical protein P5V15_008546 [Pogonomyrmex californicus]